MAGIFNSAIFNNAVFNTGLADTATVGHSDYVHWQTQRDQEEYAKSLERERIKKEEIVRLRLEAQEALLRKQELQARKDKQTKRQLAALEAEYESLMAEITAQLQALENIRKITAKRRKAVLMLLLVAANPLTPITIH